MQAYTPRETSVSSRVADHVTQSSSSPPPMCVVVTIGAAGAVVGAVVVVVVATGKIGRMSRSTLSITMRSQSKVRWTPSPCRQRIGWPPGGVR